METNTLEIIVSSPMLSAIDKNYKFCGYICPHCYARYGKPQRGGYMDITPCGQCQHKKQVN